MAKRGKEKKKNQKKNGGTCRDCLDMHVALAVGLKIRQLSGGDPRIVVNTRGRPSNVRSTRRHARSLIPAIDSSRAKSI